MDENREYVVPKDRWEELTDAERERLKSHTAKRSWYVRHSTGTAHLWLRATDNCPPDVLDRLKEIGFVLPRTGRSQG